jgi:hypothetical protein
VEAGDGESVADLVRELAASFPDVQEEAEADGVRYVRSGRPVVLLRHGTVAFRLRRDVARAALTTPGTSHSSEGPEWIELAADRRDRFSRDRARAWFDFALRMADASPRVSGA